MAAMLSLLIFAVCAGITGEPPFQNGQFAERYALKEYDDSRVQHGMHTRWYPNGTKAEEVGFNSGRKNGMYTAWYENGHKKLQCRFRNDLLDGEVAAWSLLEDRRGLHFLIAVGLAALVAGNVFSLGEALEGFTMERARDSIRSLMLLAPPEATLLQSCLNHLKLSF